MIVKRKKTFECSSLNYRGVKTSKSKHRKKVYVRLGVGLSSLCIIFFSFIYIFNSSFFAVSQVLLQAGTEDISQKQIILNSVVEEKTKGKFLGLFSKNNFLIFPKDEVVNVMKERFIDLSNVSAGLVGINKIIIKAEDRVPIFEICFTGGCLWSDEEGVLFEKKVTPYEYNPIKIDIEWTEKLGNIFDKSILARIKEIKSSFSERGLEVKSIGISKFKDLEFAIEGAKIFFDSNSDIKETMSNLDSILKEIGGTSFLNKVEYIDLRFGNKVFLKRR